MICNQCDSKLVVSLRKARDKSGSGTHYKRAPAISKVNWAAKAATFSAQITSFSAKTLKFLDKIKSGALNGYRTARDGISNLKKILFKKSTGAEITIIKFTDEGIYVVEPTIFGQVDDTYTLVYEIGEVTYKVGDNGTEEVGKLSIYQKGNDIRVVNDATTLIPSSLAAKLGNTTNLENWLTAYSGQLGNNTLSLLNQLDNSIGTRNVLESLEDAQGRFVTVIERPNTSNLVSVLQKDITGNYKLVEFSPGYNPMLNPNIVAPLSFNKLVPNYMGTPYMHPLQGNTTVKIKMSGNRSTDFARCRKELGISIADEQSALYTWHHMDDFEIINGEAYCTMQLVERSAHQGSGVLGMQHSGSAAQWRAYFGSGY